jgi:hypothetical protein
MSGIIDYSQSDAYLAGQGFIYQWSGHGTSVRRGVGGVGAGGCLRNLVGVSAAPEVGYGGGVGRMSYVVPYHTPQRVRVVLAGGVGAGGRLTGLRTAHQHSALPVEVGAGFYATRMRTQATIAVGGRIEVCGHAQALRGMATITIGGVGVGTTGRLTQLRRGLDAGIASRAMLQQELIAELFELV